MSKKSMIVAGAGLLTGVFTRMVKEVQKQGGNDEDIHRLTTPEANGVWDKIAALIIEVGKKVAEIFTIVVDYGRSVKDGITAGHYDYTNPDITEKNFPLTEGEQSKKEQSLTLYHFGKDMESEDVIAAMEKDGKRPAGLRELLAFGETNPELQRQFPIIALKDVWVNRYGNRDVPCLSRYGSGRELNLDWCDRSWDDNYRFLAVSK